MDLRVRVLAAVAGVIHDAPFVRRRAMMQCKYYVYVNVNWMRVIPSAEDAGAGGGPDQLPRGPNMITSIPAMHRPTPIQSLALGRTPSTAHSHSSAMPM